MADDSGEDVVLLGPPTDDGSSFRAIRQTKDGITTGTMRPLKDGCPMGPGSEALRLEHREGCPLPLYDVVHEDEPRPSGPAKVNSKAYQAGWDRIFGQRPSVGQA